jgi:hypothetical protein
LGGGWNNFEMRNSGITSLACFLWNEQLRETSFISRWEQPVLG